jgi:hypothetical protein
MPHYRQDSSPSCYIIAVNISLNYKYSELGACDVVQLHDPPKSPDLPHFVYIYVTILKLCLLWQFTA